MIWMMRTRVSDAALLNLMLYPRKLLIYFLQYLESICLLHKTSAGQLECVPLDETAASPRD